MGKFKGIIYSCDRCEIERRLDTSESYNAIDQKYHWSSFTFRTKDKKETFYLCSKCTLYLSERLCEIMKDKSNDN